MWKLLSTKEVFTHPRLTLNEDKVELPDGSKTIYLKYKDSGDCATIICKKPDGTILLQKEYSYPPNQLLFQFPGGYIPKNENLKIGANRELMEESGFKAKKLSLIGSYLINNRRSASKMFVYLAIDLTKKSQPGDREEIIENYWFSEKQIETMIKGGKIINNNLLASWALYKSL